MPNLRKSASMPNVRASSGTIGTMSLPMRSSFIRRCSRRTIAIVVATSRSPVASKNSAKNSSGTRRERRALARRRLRHVAAERRAPLLQVLTLLAVVGRAVEGRLEQIAVGDRDAEAVAEVAQLLLVQLLLLVGDVASLAGLAEAVALDRLGEDDGRRALMCSTAALYAA